MDTTNSLRNIVLETIDQFADDFTPFTSLDISNAIKVAGHSYRHREVANVVRELFFQDRHIQSHEYIKTNIVVRLPNGRSAMAFLYHHETTDPNEYVNRSQVSITPPVAQQTEEEETAPVAAAPAVAETEQATVAQSETHRRTIADIAAGARRSIFDVAGRVRGNVQVLVNRRGPRPEAPVETETTSQTEAPVSGRTRATIRDAATRKQRTDYRVEIPPTWLEELNWTRFNRNGIAAIAKQMDDRTVVELKRTDDVADDDTVYGLFSVNIERRLWLTKSALDKSELNHGPGQDRNMALLDNSILIY